MKSVVRLILFVGLTSLSIRAEKITHTVSPDGKSETWLIYEPVVTQSVKEYPTIRFQPGDAIGVHATGCVQTGGHGLTWKRYVNPSGPNSDRLYYGLIWIPGVIGAPPPALKRFKDINGQTLGVPANVNVAQAYLRLGYIDDGYSDNGYTSPDHGTEDQCVNQPHAQVVLNVVHGAGTTIVNPPDPTPLPFDLLSDTYDDNLIPLNPYWGYQKLHHGAPPSAEVLCRGPVQPGNSQPPQYFPDRAPCTRQPTSRDDSFWCGPHANWGPATVTGPIVWESHSTGHFGDDDYSWYLNPPNGNGLTATRTALEPEFKAAETIDHFSTPWWNDFHTAVDAGGTGPNTMVDNKFAIVSGLFSLDFEHSIHAEVHPVFAMAIRVKDSDPNDETWVLFARRYGNEGFCASDMHYLDYLPADQFIFRLPLLWGPGATLTNQDSTFLAELGAPPTPPITFVPGQGVLVTITMTENPAARQLIHGEIHLHWANADTSIHRAPVTVTRNQEEETESNQPATEGYYKTLVRNMTPAQKNELTKLVSAPKPVARSAVHLAATHNVVQAARLPVYSTGTRHPSVSSVPDADKIQSDKTLIESIHKVTQIPVPSERATSGRPVPRVP